MRRAPLWIFVAAIPQGRGHLGIEAERLGKVRDGAVVIVLAVGKGAAALEKRIGIFRINTDRLVEISDGAVDIALAFQVKARSKYTPA
jgi:hypothetical protein